MSQKHALRKHMGLQLGIVFVFTLIAQVASAHSGHDHSHWMSEAIHVVSVLAVTGVVFVAARLVESRWRKAKQSKHS